MAGSASNSPQTSALCVAWAPPGWVRDARLERELTRPGLILQYARDDFEAVALLCGDFAQHGGKSHRAMILMLVEPTKLVGLREALQSVSDRVPALHLWVFDPSRQPVLRGVTRFELGQMIEPVSKPEPMATPAWVGPVVASGTERWSQMVTGPEAERNPSKPNPLPQRPAPGLRLTLEPVRRPVQPVDGDGGLGADGSDGGAGGTNPPVLTNEELTMLLGDEEKGSGNDAGRG